MNDAPLFKYPSTPHLPQSPGRSQDDTTVRDTSHFAGRSVVVTEKLDGENATLYHHHYHARSLDSRHHPSRDWIKRFWAAKRHDIPSNLRICGENLYARHSIGYDGLRSYFYGFSVWDNERNLCLSWAETLDWFALLDIVPVPVLYEGVYSDAIIGKLINAIDTETQEGFVVRAADAFSYDAFANNMAKWVRPRHVQTDTHWMHAEIVPNGLAAPTSGDEQ